MAKIKKWFDDHPTWKRGGIVTLVLFVAWVLFLWLVKDPPIDTTSAMIMIWISFAVVILTLFPGLLNKIKKIKVKDFELELQESVNKATSIDYFSISEGPDYQVSNKSDFSEFVDLFLTAKRNPDKPILLLVNLRHRRAISIPALFIYLYFLDLYNSHVISLFVSSSNRSDSLEEINKENVIGAANGKKILQVILDRFPDLIISITHNGLLGNTNLNKEENLKEYFRTIYRDIKGEDSEDNIFLTQGKVRKYFISYLNDEEISDKITQEDEKTILNAILKDEEYLIVYSNNKFETVIPLAIITSDISKKVLQDILKERTPND